MVHIYLGPIYEMRPVCEEDIPSAEKYCKHDYGWDDWEEYKQPFPEGVDLLESKNLKFNVNHPQANEWDYYFDPAVSDTFGVFSQQANDLLWPYFNGCCKRLQIAINDRPYFVLISTGKEIECVDITNSVGTLSDFGNFFTISKKLRFFREKLSDPLIFVPREARMLAVTESIRRKVEEANLQGFEFIDCENLYGYYGQSSSS